MRASLGSIKKPRRLCWLQISSTKLVASMDYLFSHAMIVIVFLLAIVSTSLVQAEDEHRWSRAPQHRRLQYKTPDGSKVQGRFYSPDTQWHSRQESNQRSDRQEMMPKPTVPVFKQPEVKSSYHYKPFSEVPDHIKQLIYQAYTPQVPYVNPYAFFYGINLSPVSQDISEHSTTPQPIVTSTFKPTPAYRTNYPPWGHKIPEVKAPSSKQSPFKYNSVPVKDTSRNDLRERVSFGERYLRQDQTKRSLERDIGDHGAGQPGPGQGQDQDHFHYQQMPEEIAQILQFQAQIPYNVLANQINFQFQKPFVPKPLPEELLKSSQSKYPTKVYFIKSDGEIVDSSSVRDVPGRDIKYRNV